MKDLKELFNTDEHQEAVSRKWADEGIEWTFIPTRSTRIVGLWKAAVKSTKQHLKKIRHNAA